MYRNIKKVSGPLLLATALLASFAAVASAWTGPTAAPPQNNVAAPINVGSVSQVKTGGFWASSVGSDNGYCIGTSCIRSWPVGSTSQWTSGAGGTIYYTGGNVGIGTANPTTPLHVVTAIGGTAARFTDTRNGTLDIRFPVLNQTDLFANSGNLTFTNQSGTIMGIYGGNVGIGTASPSWPLTIQGGANNWAEVINWPASSAPGYGILVGTFASGYSQFQNATGYYTQLAYQSWGVVTNGNIQAAAYTYQSDERLKKNITPLSGALDTVLNIQPVTYLWKDTSLGTSTQIGFIAQQVQKVAPGIVHIDPATNLESIDYPRMTPFLTGAVQELNQKISVQQKEIDDLKAQIAAIKAGK